MVTQLLILSVQRIALGVEDQHETKADQVPEKRDPPGQHGVSRRASPLELAFNPRADLEGESPKKESKQNVISDTFCRLKCHCIGLHLSESNQIYFLHQVCMSRYL